MSDVTMRKATEADLEAITAIANEAIENTTATWDDQLVTLEQERDWFAERQRPGAVVLVGEADGDVVGFATYGTFRDKSGYRETVEHSVYLSPAARGKGLGTALLRELIKNARDEGIHAMVGALTADNEASVRLHRSLGFLEVGTLPQVGQKFGRWLDLVFVQLILDERSRPSDPIDD